jgi:ABC-type transport system involved in multi-copper enzyme maturation permease subunit
VFIGNQKSTAGESHLKAVLLIAANFAREQRWPLITLLAYVLVFGGAIAFVNDASAEDALFFLRSVGVYGLAFTGLMAASAINNERRTRRMLAVLSKSIQRGQYLAGLLLGVILDSAIYCLAVGGIGSLALARRHEPASGVWELVGVLLASFVLAATAAMFFSTFLHPLMATAAAAVALAILGAVGQVMGPPWTQVLPAWTLADSMVNFGLRAWQPPWTAAGWALGHALIFCVLATIVFSRRDIAVAIE